MKVGGVENLKDIVYGPVVFDRGRDENDQEVFLAFYAQPVWSFEEFEERCPLPENDNYVFTKKGKEKDFDAPEWKEKMRVYDRKRWGWYVLKSLEPSDIELDTATIDDPDTWGNVESELRSELNFYEFAALMKLVDQANSMDLRKLDANRQSFLRRQARRTEETTQNSGQENTVSSELA